MLFFRIFAVAMSTETAHIKSQLSGRIGKPDVERLARTAEPADLFALLYDADSRTANNAAWVMTHLPNTADPWLAAHQNDLVELAMTIESVTLRRLTMNLLTRTAFAPDDVRTDFLDFCLEVMMSKDETYGVRALAMKLAAAQCIHYPELVAELRLRLNMMEPSMLPAGLRCCRKNILKKLNS